MTNNNQDITLNHDFAEKINLEHFRNLRPRKNNEDYNVENLKRLLDKISQHEKTQYIMGFKVKKEWKYFVSIDRKKHSRETLNGGNSFYLLNEEFVNTTLLKNNNLNDFMEELRRNEGVWVKMTTYFKQIYHRVALKEDRESVIRRHGTYQKLRINYEKNGSKEQI